MTLLVSLSLSWLLHLSDLCGLLSLFDPLEPLSSRILSEPCSLPIVIFCWDDLIYTHNFSSANDFQRCIFRSLPWLSFSVVSWTFYGSLKFRLKAERRALSTKSNPLVLLLTLVKSRYYYTYGSFSKTQDINLDILLSTCN